MLTEISLKSKRKREIEDWTEQLQVAINKIPESDKHSVSLIFCMFFNSLVVIINLYNTDI